MAFLFLINIYKENNIDMNLNKNNGYKGSDAINRAKQLMQLNENAEPTVNKRGFVLVKKGADNKAYAIVKESSKYFLKSAPLTEGVHFSQFDYINGETSKRNFMYESYTKAVSSINNALIALCEEYGGSNTDLYNSDVEVDFSDVVVKENELEIEDDQLLEFEIEDDNAEIIFGDDVELDAINEVEFKLLESLSDISDILDEGLRILNVA